MKKAFMFFVAILLSFLPLPGRPGSASAAAPEAERLNAESKRYVAVGNGTIFALPKPSGWEMDTEGAKKEGLPVIFYPSGQTWGSAPVVMYANTALNDCKTAFESFIASDEANFRRENSKIVSAKIAEMKADKLRVVVKSFSGDKYGNTEAVAYFDNAGGSFITLVLSSKTAKLFDETYPMFKELITGFQLVGNSVSCAAVKTPKQKTST